MKKLFNRRKHDLPENEFADNNTDNTDELNDEADVEDDNIDADKINKEEENTDAAGETDDIEEDAVEDEDEFADEDAAEDEDGFADEDAAEDEDEFADEDASDDEEESEDDDDVDMEESSEEGMSWEENRRAYRRKRRIRNQIIAYSVVAVVLVLLVTAGIAVGHGISNVLKEKNQDEEIFTDQSQDGDEEFELQPDGIIVEAPPEIEENTLDEQLEEIVNNCISVMPLEDKVAGLFVITPEALTGVGTAVQAGDSTQEALNNYAVGGLVYFSENIIDKEQLSQMLSNTVSMSKYPIFLAVDEEGGTVSRVANSAIEVVQVDDMQTIGMTGDATAAYEAGMTIGSYLNELGFNLDFAPVADVVTSAGNLSLGNRSFGTDPSLCAEMVSNMVDGIQGTSVSACLKHFPGIGSSTEDTHDGKVEITKSLDGMKSSDFMPFEAGIEAGVDLIMVSHVTASSVDTSGVPSSLSKTMITDILRTELGFEGVVITDALNMGAITNYYTSEEATVNAVMAGADMILMPENFKDAYEGLLNAVREGRISEERIDESLRRIYRIKYADKLE